MTSTSNGQFISLNAERARKQQTLVEVRRGVVRRLPPPPVAADRSLVEGFIPTAPPPAPTESEPDTVVTKKKKKTRVLVSAETRAVAVARVRKLIEAGNPATKAVAAVAKELGVSDSSVMNWRTAANGSKPAAAPKKKTAKRVSRPRIEDQIAAHVNGAPELGGLDLALDLLELASRASSLLSAASRKRLVAELTSRLA